MKFSGKIETDDMLKDLESLAGRATVADFSSGVGAAAEFIMSQAQKRAPRDFGHLANSAFVDNVRNSGDKNGSKMSIEYGFNEEYGTVMDSGWKTSVIRPRKAKMLFVPLTRRARRIGATKGGIRSLVASTKSGGLKLGRDFIFVKEVRPAAAQEGGHIGRDGEKKGPNFYFSGAQERAVRTKNIQKVIVRFAEAAIAKRLR